MRLQLLRILLVVSALSLSFGACADAEKDKQGYIVDGSKFGFQIGSSRSEILKIAAKNSFDDVSAMANISNKETRCFGTMKESHDEIIVLMSEKRDRKVVCIGLENGLVSKVSWRHGTYDP